MVAMLKMPAGMTLVDEQAQERRIFPRAEVHVHIEGRRLDHSLEALQHPQLTLALRDLSAGGMSAITQTPLMAGERVAVYFPPRGAERGWDAYGRVVRCQPSGFGYRVALEFDPLPAA